MPRAAAAEHWLPGAKRPVRTIGSKTSSYVRFETPSFMHRSRKESLSYRAHASGESSNSEKASTSGAAVARSVIGRLRKPVRAQGEHGVSRSATRWGTIQVRVAAPHVCTAPAQGRSAAAASALCTRATRPPGQPESTAPARHSP